MADMLKSIEEIKKMLDDLKKEEALVLHESAKPAAPEPEPEEDSKFCIKNGAYIRISEDKMEAWIYLNPPKQGESFYSRDLIMQFISENKVVRGLHTSNIAAIAKKHVYEREILIARGKVPIEGVDGYFEYFFDISSKKEPKEREDGTVDYSSMSELTNINAGDVIAKYHHAIQSEDGFDVTGKEIKAKPAKELAVLKGRGFNNDADPDTYVATMAGKISLVNGRIDIKNVHEIRGDVDLVTGKVEFFGDIHITGTVGAGVVIRASRNITIDGVVESAYIYAGGDVVLTRGIQGNGKGRVVAKGNVSAEFIEFAYIESVGNIRSNSFMNANVFAEGEVIADGKKGVIIGGNVRGLHGVQAQTVGNETETKTTVGAGFSAEDYDSYVEFMSKESEAQKLLSDVVDRMTEILKNKRLGRDKYNTATDKELLELNEKKDIYFKNLDEARMGKEKIAARIEEGKGAQIRVNGKVYMGTTVALEGELLVLQEDMMYRKFKNEGGRIISDSL
ncbi:MAG: FapA family protein [Lachnospiraceae bacterium]|nr:FapA family protein [Lachnospiraceae bacterium]